MWGPPRVHLGANGFPLGKTMGQNRKKLQYPKIRFLRKMEATVMAPNHGGATLGAILLPMGSHWVKKMGQNRKKLPCRKTGIFDFPTVINFTQKLEVKVMEPNHGGDPLGSILGPMGSHWVQKMGQNRKKLPCHKIPILTTICHRFFSKTGSYGYGAKSRWGPPSVHFRANGVPLGKKKLFKTIKNYHALKFEFSTTPQSSIFREKWKLGLWRQITEGPP